MDEERNLAINSSFYHYVGSSWKHELEAAFWCLICRVRSIWRSTVWLVERCIMSKLSTSYRGGRHIAPWVR